MGRSNRFLRVIALPALGLAVVEVGFLCDVLFAGIPYQDPTPALQARWELHRSVADVLYGAGGIIFLLGLLVIPVILGSARKQARRCGKGVED